MLCFVSSKLEWFFTKPSMLVLLLKRKTVSHTICGHKHRGTISVSQKCSNLLPFNPEHCMNWACHLGWRKDSQVCFCSRKKQVLWHIINYILSSVTQLTVMSNRCWDLAISFHWLVVSSLAWGTSERRMKVGSRNGTFQLPSHQKRQRPNLAQHHWKY